MEIKSMGRKKRLETFKPYVHAGEEQQKKRKKKKTCRSLFHNFLMNSFATACY
jgi:hypothetical protein